MRHNVTRNDVARLAGVSPAVVSYVVNSSKFVSEEKTRAVKAAIKELGYQPNQYARSLKTNQSMQIAFVCDNLRNDWLELAERKFFDRGYFVSHCYSRDGDDFIKKLIARQFDGIFMLSNRYSSQQLNSIAGEGIPIVLFKTREYEHELAENIVTVVPDYYDGVAKTVSYLAMKGHRRIILTPPLRYDTHNFKGGFRKKAYLEALRKVGLEADESLICRNTETFEQVWDDIFQMLTGSLAENRPTAIITSNDYTAVHVLQYIHRMGLQVPKDIAVTGADNTYIAEAVTPTLTSVDFSKAEFSQTLVDTMLALIRGEHPQDTYIKVSLAIRESA